MLSLNIGTSSVSLKAVTVSATLRLICDATTAVLLLATFEIMISNNTDLFGEDYFPIADPTENVMGTTFENYLTPTL